MAQQDSAPLRSIHDAVKLGNVQILETMVKNGASVNELDTTKDHFTPLHWACHVGSLECLHWLLWHGADPNVTTSKAWMPAHIAAIRGQDACMQALANNGINLSARDLRGATPAHMAAAHGHSFTLHTLLSAGVDVNAIDKNGWTALHFAAFHGRLGCVQLLLRWGGHADDVENSGCSAAHLAAMEGQLSCLKFIISKSESISQLLGARNNNGETPKMLAERFYKNDVFEYISNIEWERDHPEEAENMAFPAHVAAYTGDLEHLRMLIDNHIVHINERDDRGSTPAHKAAGQGHVEILQWLLEMGADMSITNHASETPKDVARRFARLAAVRLLTDSQERESDATKIQHFDGEIDVEDINDAVIDKQYTVVNDKEARERAKKKLEELEKLLEIAVNNYIQLGGVIQADQKKQHENKSTKSGELPLNRNANELEMQLEHERSRREKMEAKLDQYKLDNAYLMSQLQQLSESVPERAERHGQLKKSGKKRSGLREDGTFVRRSVGSSRRQHPLRIA